MDLAFLARGVVNGGADEADDLAGDVAQRLDMQIEPAARGRLADAHLHIRGLSIGDHALFEGAGKKVMSYDDLLAGQPEDHPWADVDEHEEAAADQVAVLRQGEALRPPAGGRAGVAAHLLRAGRDAGRL